MPFAVIPGYPTKGVRTAAPKRINAGNSEWKLDTSKTVDLIKQILDSDINPLIVLFGSARTLTLLGEVAKPDIDIKYDATATDVIRAAEQSSHRTCLFTSNDPDVETLWGDVYQRLVLVRV